MGITVISFSSFSSSVLRRHHWMENRPLYILVEDVLHLDEAGSVTTAGSTTVLSSLLSSLPLPINCFSFSLYITGASEMSVRKTSLRTTFGENRMVESDCASVPRLAENVLKISPICSVEICIMANHEVMWGENAPGRSPPSTGGCRRTRRLHSPKRARAPRRRQY